MNILAIGAHFDDIEISMGGTIAKAIKKEHYVKCLIMTESDYSNYDGTLMRSKELSQQEGISALAILGVTDIDIFNFSTKNMPYNSQSVEAINKIIDKVKPDMIFTHHINDTHQAHKNTAWATISASRYYNTIYMYEPTYPSGRGAEPFNPHCYINISDTIDLKITSLKAHESQYKKYGKHWIEAIKGRARMRGLECGSDYAECFTVVREKREL